MKIHNVCYKNSPQFKWDDYNWKSVEKAIKIHSASDEVTIINNPQKKL